MESRAEVKRWIMNLWHDARTKKHMSDQTFAEVMLEVLIDVIRRP